MIIYRAMEESDGLPRPGSTATKMGIRKNKDIEVDEQDQVQRPLFLAGKPNGLSCAPSIAELPAFALPKSHGGSNPKTVIWKIDSDDLSSDLIAEQDDVSHISIGPAKSMGYNEYVAAIEATAPKWIKVD